MTSTRRLLLSLLIVVAPVAITVPLVQSWRDRLPPRLASHWSSSEAPDSFIDRDTFLTWRPIVSIAVMVVGVLVVLLLRRGRRLAVAIVGGVGGFLAALALLIAIPNLDLADPATAGIGAEVALLLPLMIGTSGLGWWVHGQPERTIVPADAPPPPELPRLRPGDEARFSEHAVPWLVAGVIAGVIGGLGVVIWLVLSPWLGAEIVLFGLLVAALVVGRVRVSRREDVSLSAGPFTHRVPIAELTGARVIPSIHPFGDYGGWGLRFVPGVVAIVARSGPGIEIGRTDNRRVVITTNHPDRLAAVVNTLADQRFGPPAGS